MQRRKLINSEVPEKLKKSWLNVFFKYFLGRKNNNKVIKGANRHGENT